MSFITLAVILLGTALGFGLGLMRGKQLLAGAVSRPIYDRAVEEKVALATKLEELDDVRDRLESFQERALAAEADKRALEARLKEQQEQMKAEFKNTATSIFEDMSKKFSTHSEKQIGDLLNPLKLNINDFKELVTKSFTAQGKEQHTLKAEIEKIVLQTDGLTKALRGDVKAQGNWGEVMLERILEESSLRKDLDYVLQGAEMGLSGAEGNRLRPDVIINLPDGKHIIIDSKVSLVAYERYCSEQNLAQQETYLQDFLRSVKAHVAGLESKRYQDIEKLGTPDFVLMFMPIEGAYSLAMQKDRELHSMAWGKRIVIVCPTTLFATLQTIASLWKIERQNKNAQEIATEAGKMYDKFADFIKDMNAVGARLGQLQTSYDDAFSKLSKGRGNLVSRAEKLKDLDVKTTKSLAIKSDDEESDAPVKLVAEG